MPYSKKYLDQLLRTTLYQLKPPSGHRMSRATVAAEHFHISEYEARKLCLNFHLNPDEVLSNLRVCPECHDVKMDHNGVCLECSGPAARHNVTTLDSFPDQFYAFYHGSPLTWWERMKLRIWSLWH